ncbi:MAG: hypothetical protein JXR65_10140 [Bacteroidales bacterium]|nr:hypothetical protein [Bacteroidales bacterium]
MKNKFYSIITIILVISISLISCSKQEDITTEDNPNNEKQEILKETSILLGKVLADPEVKLALNQ